MNATRQYLRIVSGEAHGPLATTARLALSAVSPAYAAMTRLRNTLFDVGVKRAIDLPRPTVSVGNITAGGTGKTPVVAWIVDVLRERGFRPAVLMRGYKARPGTKGDEQRLLEQLLGSAVPVEADPNRARAADCALARGDANVFVLDDGFQHRRVRRAVDLVLVDATCPFGYGKVLPRGLLREPPSGLRRATAFVITRVGLVEPSTVDQIRATLSAQSAAPVFASDFDVSRFEPVHAPPIDGLHGRRVVLASGIGNPAAFELSMVRQGAHVAASLAFGDHHEYTSADARGIAVRARESGAEAVVVTAKDWVKLEPLWPATLGPLYVARQSVRFEAGQGEALTELVLSHLRSAQSE